MVSLVQFKVVFFRLRLESACLFESYKKQQQYKTRVSEIMTT